MLQKLILTLIRSDLAFSGFRDFNKYSTLDLVDGSLIFEIIS